MSWDDTRKVIETHEHMGGFKTLYVGQPAKRTTGSRFCKHFAVWVPRRNCAGSPWIYL